MTPVMYAAVRAKEVLRRVEDRLVDGGAVVELAQFQGLSADETDVLLRLERGMDGPMPHALVGFLLAGLTYVAECTCGARLPGSHPAAARKAHDLHRIEWDS